MLGIQREISSDEGITTLEMTQVAYIEQAWEDWKELSGRITKKAPTRPADGLKFTDLDGKLVETDSAEYEAVTKRGYRRVVGTILWPARNAYPIISYAVVQLCRAMEKPSERAWESAMHCLHYLYAIRHEGIRFSSGRECGTVEVNKCFGTLWIKPETAARELHPTQRDGALLKPRGAIVRGRHL